MIMDSKKFKDGSFEYINLDGKNVGATMRLHQRGTKGGEGKDCCCINIYVNNNVQGVTNSVLHDSEVRMRDPGISLYFENLKVDKGTPTCHNTLRPACLFLCIIALLFLLLVLLFSTRVILVII